SLHGARFVPDLDGDGVDDVIVAAANQIPYGRVYVFSGATGERIHLLASPVNAMGEFGSAVVALSDGDGDGFGDFAVLDMREPWNDGSGFRGVVHLFSGASGTLRASARYRSPFYMNACGDVSGDGVTDFLLQTSAQLPEYPGSNGTVRLYSGTDLSILHTFPSPDPVANPGGFGGAIGGCPDLDHDGCPEILIGSATYQVQPGPVPAPTNGAVYIYSGRTFSLLRLLVQPTGLLNTAFGNGLTWVPDVNHDGVPEIAVAAPNEPIGPPPYQIRGAVYIILSCPADWDADGDATAADFFGFLDSFFALDQYADFNRDGLVNSQDFFDYLSAFFAGCE
ncbi:MAG: GC-type dockerin domain-anchored protein, partial [Phycisphaerales bacterium]